MRFTTLNSSNGLPQDSIRAIAQDNNGLMWFATEDGIARYDGQLVKTYRYDPKDPYSIPQNVATQFLTDHKNRLWITTQGEGVLVLDQTKGRFLPIVNLPDATKKLEIGHFASALYQRSEGEMIVGSENGVFSLSTNDLRVTRQLVSLDELGSRDIVNAIWEDANKRLWIMSRDGKLAYLSLAGKLVIINHSAEHFYSRKMIDGIGTVLTAGEKGFFKVDYERESLIPVLQQVLPVGYSALDIEQSSAKSQPSLIWIATGSGLIRHNLLTKKTHLIEINRQDENSISSRKLTKLFLSKESILWIGSSDNGINTINLNDYGFTSSSAYDIKAISNNGNVISKPNTLVDNVIWSIYRDHSGTLWIGTNNGLSYQKKGQSDFSSLALLKGKRVWSIAEANGYLWFGTGSGLLRYSKVSREVVVYSAASTHKNTQLSGDIIRLLLFDKHRNALWVGTHNNGLSRLDFDTGLVEHFRPEPNNPSSLPHQWIRSLYLDKENRLWVGTNAGISLYLDESKSFRRPDYSQLEDSKLENSKLRVTDVRGIYQYDSNTLWLSSEHGLHRFNINTFQVEETLHEKDGLARSTLYSLIVDDQESFWITTTHGLTHYDPKSKVFRNFFVTHHLQSNEFNFNANWKDKDGTIYVGGPGGMTYFHPDNVHAEYSSHDPVILGIKSYDRHLNEQQELQVSGRSSLAKNKLVLEANRRKILFDFTTAEYIFTHDVKYRYRLLGYNEMWTEARNRDIPVQYTNLLPGNYEFQLQTIDKSLDDNKLISIALHIKAYFWETWWFKLLVGAVLLLLLFLLVKHQLKIKLDKQMAQERSDHYQMIVHDLGPSLKRSKKNISLMIKALIKDKSCIPDALQHLHIDTQYAFGFIKQLRTISEVEGYSVHHKETFLLEDLVYESLAPFKEQRNRIELSPIPDVSVQIYNNSLSFIIINLISNAINYSADHSPIKVDFDSGESDLTIRVSDQGVGFSEELKSIVFQPYTRANTYKVEGLGIGLSLIKKITENYSGSVTIKNNTPMGSIITILLKDIITIIMMESDDE